MPQFSTIHTLYGLTAMAKAEATGTPINLTHMAVGDGNGSAVTPSDAQETLVREIFRAPVNRVFQDPSTPNKLTAELVIPASAGGFVLREVGIFDNHGSLFAVGNLPETYKPTADDGAFSDMVVRMDFMVANAGVVTLQIDPNVAVATQSWISNNITAAKLLPGGTTSQVLRKKSNADGDTEWADQEVADVVVDTIEEHQTLAASQTVVTLATVTTRGLAVYVSGVRLSKEAGANGWQTDATSPDIKIVLGKSYSAGTPILLVQNEPTGAVPYPLVRDLNLSDVPDKPTARTNLDIFSKSEARQMAPAGQVAYFARTAAPAGWLKANGAAVSRTAYADLFAAIGTTFGAGDGFNTFNLPDLRGEFIRGLDDGRGVDSNRALGASQGDAYGVHAHGGSVATAGSHAHGASTDSQGNHAHSGSTDAQGNHGHTASTDSQGNHAHSGSTDAQGSHSHGIDDPGHSHGTYGDGYTDPPYGIYAGPGYMGHNGGRDYDNYTYRTSTDTTNISIRADGSHAHNLSTSGAGDHAHGVSISSNGNHSHSLSINNNGSHSHGVSVSAAGDHAHTLTINNSGSSETRPRNLALLACIKF